MKVISFNINGALNPIKRSKILSKLKKERAQIALLQETHMSQSEHAKLKRMGFRHVFSSSDKSGHKRGVATLISNSVNYEHISTTSDDEGRFIKSTGKIEGTIITIVNVYIPPGSDWLLYRRIFDLMVNSQGVVICGGDFNIRLTKRDSSGTATQNNPISRKINSLMEELGIIDVWRELHPNGREYTHYSCPHKVYSRLDYFFMFGPDRFKVEKCCITTIDLSDHSPVSMSLRLGRKKRTTLWRFNSYILNNPATLEKIKKDIKEYLEQNTSEEISPAILWDTLKAVMRGKLISLTTFLKKCKRQKLLDLEGKLKELQSLDSTAMNANLKQEIRKTQGEINDIYSQEAQKKLIFLKQRYYETGGKSAKYLAYKLRKQQEENTIHKIRNPKTQIIENKIEKIQDCFENFYRELYTQPQAADEDQIDSFLDSLDLPKLSEAHNKDLTRSITMKEVNSAISRLKTGKSPGSDGYNAEWYKHLREELSPILLDTFNWILKGGEIPPSWREAIISVIPKEGKDKLDCDNYRPISVLNLDYKLFTSIMARRLESVLVFASNLDQAGFVCGRQTTDNIRRTLHIMDHITKNKTKSLLVAWDARKAFDGTRWLFLYKVMHKFGFHDSFIKVIQSLYDKPTARVKINGDLSDSFVLGRGSRQGCAISPLLFDLFIEPLGQLIRQSGAVKGIRIGASEHKVAMFADDILGYLSEPEGSLNELMSLFTYFGEMSGYTLNVSKTQVMALNFTVPRGLREKYDLKWDNDVITYLGIKLTKDPAKLLEANYDPLSNKIKSDLHRWNLIPFLSLNSRISAVKMNILPRLLYVFRNLPVEVSDNQFREWDKCISRFIWQGKKPIIKFSTLQLSKDKGGMALPCLRNYYYAAQITPLLYWCNAEYKAKWKDLESSLATEFPLQAVLGDKGLAARLARMDNPWVNLTLKIWQKVVRSCELTKMLRLFRWCAFDTDFAPNKTDRRFDLWRGKGITNYASLIYRSDIHSFQTLQEKHGLERVDFYRYLQVRHYINQECKIKDLSVVEAEFYSIIKAALDSTPSKAISELYCALSNADNRNTLYIKEKWEREAGIEISEEQWEQIWDFQWSSTCSMDWRVFGKILTNHCVQYLVASYLLNL